MYYLVNPVNRKENNAFFYRESIFDIYYCRGVLATTFVCKTHLRNMERHHSAAEYVKPSFYVDFSTFAGLIRIIGLFSASFLRSLCLKEIGYFW